MDMWNPQGLVQILDTLLKVDRHMQALRQALFDPKEVIDVYAVVEGFQEGCILSAPYIVRVTNKGASINPAKFLWKQN